MFNLCGFFFHQIKVRRPKINTSVETQAKKTKNLNLVGKPMFINPSSTPVTIATQMMKSQWKNAADLL